MDTKKAGETTKFDYGKVSVVIYSDGRAHAEYPKEYKAVLDEKITEKYHREVESGNNRCIVYYGAYELVTLIKDIENIMK